MLCRGLAALLAGLAVAAISGVVAGRVVAITPIIAGLLLLRLYRDLDPAGWVFEIDPSGGWRCYRPRGGQCLRGELRSLGRFPSLLWLELDASDRPAGGSGGRAAVYGSADRTGGLAAWGSGFRCCRPPRQWLICGDALADADWRRLRRELRLRVAAA